MEPWRSALSHLRVGMIHEWQERQSVALLELIEGVAQSVAAMNTAAKLLPSQQQQREC
jgi:hypothetical protein